MFIKSLFTQPKGKKTTTPKFQTTDDKQNLLCIHTMGYIQP